MIVRFTGGPLAGIELETADAPWFGNRFTVGDTAGLYVPAHRDPATGTVLAEMRAVTSRSRKQSGCAGGVKCCVVSEYGAEAAEHVRDEAK